MTIDKPHLGENALQLIRQDIITCSLLPGSQISEAQLASRYGIGKAPVRYALAQLNQSGLIKALPRRGYLITNISLGDVVQLYDLRAIIEPATARLAAGRIDTAYLQRLDQIYADETADEEALIAANREIHAAIAVATGNKYLEEITITMLDRMERILRYAWFERRRTGRTFQGHRDLIEAIGGNEPERAVELAAAHVEEGRRVVLGGLTQGDANKDIKLTRII
ncbi:GntR family transcriptional regulator [Aestuariivirga sp. YIM B02566]|jgi:DNA-binding GntR family transcriptional regulator|uniref:GntR family transcriptional regulator n=1 Tax=Taklimakanibacter albus TaxID=2800327 RepID=UPI001FEE5149|nr:GntR family transcriptional regulator [Aestuariivirga sp. YIM B02566]